MPRFVELLRVGDRQQTIRDVRETIWESRL